MQHKRLQGKDNWQYRIKEDGPLHLLQHWAMLINNCYMEINTTFQLERTDKQYTVMANQTTLSTYLGEDAYKYKDNVDDLTFASGECGLQIVD